MSVRPWRNTERNSEAKADLLGRFAREVNPFVDIGQRLGVEAVDLVLGLLGPGTVFVPTRENFWRMLERDLRDARIRAEFNGRNHEELRQRYGLKSTKQVRNILAERKRETKKQTSPSVSAMETGK